MVPSLAQLADGTLPLGEEVSLVATGSTPLEDLLHFAVVGDEELDVGRHQQRAVRLQGLLQFVVAGMPSPAVAFVPEVPGTASHDVDLAVLRSVEEVDAVGNVESLPVVLLKRVWLLNRDCYSMKSLPDFPTIGPVR